MGVPRGALFLVQLAACTYASIDLAAGPPGVLELVENSQEEGELCVGEAYGRDCCCSADAAGGACAEAQFDEVLEVEPGLWTVVTKRTDMSEPGPPHSRMIVFRIPDNTSGFMLVLANAIELKNSTLRGLQELEGSPDGGPVMHIVATLQDNRTAADLYLHNYLKFFPNATIHVTAAPTSGILDASNVSTLDLTAPLAELRPHLHVQAIDGVRDPFSLYRNLKFRHDVRHELFFFHPATKTLAIASVLWYQSCDISWSYSLGFPGVAKNKVQIWNYLGATLFADAGKSAESFEDMLAFDFTRFLGLRGELGAMPPPEEAKQLVITALQSWWGPTPEIWLRLFRIVLAVLLLLPCLASCVNVCRPDPVPT